MTDHKTLGSDGIMALSHVLDSISGSVRLSQSGLGIFFFFCSVSGNGRLYMAVSVWKGCACEVAPHMNARPQGFPQNSVL